MTRRLMTAIAFLTRIPINPEPPFDGEDVARSTVFFPLVGCLMAALQVAVLYGLQGLAVPPVLQAVIVTIIMVLLGGGLHQDGLADMADGFGGGMTRDDVLRIMRDSTIGTYGGLALILSMAANRVAFNTGSPCRCLAMVNRRCSHLALLYLSCLAYALCAQSGYRRFNHSIHWPE